MMSIRAVLLVAVGLGAAAVGGAAQDKTESDVVRITHRHSVVITEEKPIKRIVVGDQEILEVSVVDPQNTKQLLLIGKAPGRTNAMVWYSDESRREWVVQVEYELGLLREQLAAIDKAISVETSSDGKFVVLKGNVATVDIIQAAVEATTRYVDAGAPKTAPAPGEKAVKTGAQVLNMMTAKAAAPKTEELIQAAIKPYSLDVKVSRARQGSFTDDQADTFVLEGTVPNQTALTQLLIVVDRMLGGPGSEFKVVANEGGGLQETKTAATEQGTSGQGGTSNRTVVLSSQAPLHPTLAANNLNSNIARGAAVMGKNGRWISFVRVRALPQVQVSVRVLDLDRNMVRTVGANWIEAWSERGARLSKSTQGEVALTIMNGLLTNTATIVDHRLLLTQVITALETKGYARTLSEPNLSTLSGEVATFLVGGDVPIQTLSASTTSTFSGFAFREFGIRLTVRPQVEEDGRTMTLDVYPDVSDVNTNGASGALPGAPAFKRTALVSTTRIKDGESLIIGGLTGKGESPLTEQVPVLGDIPLLGNLFSRKTDRNSERELALILIPKIIYPKPASALALEASETGLQVRSGSFKDPDLGTMQVVPEFFRRDEERR